VKALEEAEATLDRWYGAVGDAAPGADAADGVLAALDDDLNTPAALAELHRLAAAGEAPMSETLKASANLLGLLTQTKSERESAAPTLTPAESETVSRLLAGRTTARSNKDWKASDHIRDELAKMGLTIKDNKDGSTTWELKR